MKHVEPSVYWTFTPNNDGPFDNPEISDGLARWVDQYCKDVNDPSLVWSSLEDTLSIADWQLKLNSSLMPNTSHASVFTLKRACAGIIPLSAGVKPVLFLLALDKFVITPLRLGTLTLADTAENVLSLSSQAFADLCQQTFEIINHHSLLELFRLEVSLFRDPSSKLQHDDWF